MSVNYTGGTGQSAAAALGSADVQSATNAAAAAAHAAGVETGFAGLDEEAKARIRAMWGSANLTPEQAEETAPYESFFLAENRAQSAQKAFDQYDAIQAKLNETGQGGTNIRYLPSIYDEYLGGSGLYGGGSLYGGRQGDIYGAARFGESPIDFSAEFDPEYAQALSKHNDFKSSGNPVGGGYGFLYSGPEIPKRGWETNEYGFLYPDRSASLSRYFSGAGPQWDQDNPGWRAAYNTARWNTLVDPRDANVQAAAASLPWVGDALAEGNLLGQRFNALQEAGLDDPRFESVANSFAPKLQYEIALYNESQKKSGLNGFMERWVLPAVVAVASYYTGGAVGGAVGASTGSSAAGLAAGAATGGALGSSLNYAIATGESPFSKDALKAGLKGGLVNAFTGGLGAYAGQGLGAIMPEVWSGLSAGQQSAFGNILADVAIKSANGESVDWRRMLGRLASEGIDFDGVMKSLGEAGIIPAEGLAAYQQLTGAAPAAAVAQDTGGLLGERGGQLLSGRVDSPITTGLTADTAGGIGPGGRFGVPLDQLEAVPLGADPYTSLRTTVTGASAPGLSDPAFTLDNMFGFPAVGGDLPFYSAPQSTEQPVPQQVEAGTLQRMAASVANKASGYLFELLGEDSPDQPQRSEEETQEGYQQRVNDWAIDTLGLDAQAMAERGLVPGSPEYQEFILSEADRVIGELAGQDTSFLLQAESVEDVQQLMRGMSNDQMSKLARALHVRGALSQQSGEGRYVDPFTGIEEEVVGPGLFNPAVAAAQRGTARQVRELAGLRGREAREAIGMLGRDVDLYGLQAGADARNLRARLADQEEELRRRRGLEAGGFDDRGYADQLLRGYSDEELSGLLGQYGSEDEQAAALARLLGV